jgi:hypothetical protein
MLPSPGRKPAPNLKPRATRTSPKSGQLTLEEGLAALPGRPVARAPAVRGTQVCPSSGAALAFVRSGLCRLQSPCQQHGCFCLRPGERLPGAGRLAALPKFIRPVILRNGQPASGAPRSPRQVSGRFPVRRDKAGSPATRGPDPFFMNVRLRPELSIHLRM